MLVGCQNDRVSTYISRALGLWGADVPDGAAGLTAFRAVYADPITINGEQTPLQVLVDRAQMMRSAFAGLRHDVLEELESPGRVAFAFRITGRHVGPLATPLGTIAASGKRVEIAGMDIFVVDQARDRVTAVWAQADYLALLIQASAVSLTQPADA